jgi:hypothetical protein
MFIFFSPTLDHLQYRFFHNFTMARPNAIAVSSKSAPSEVGIAKATLLTLPAELKLVIFLVPQSIRFCLSWHLF